MNAEERSCWAAKVDSPWMRRFCELEAFRASSGHCECNDDSHRELYAWLVEVRLL